MVRYGKPDPSRQDVKVMWQYSILQQVNRVMTSLNDPDTRNFFMTVMGLDCIMEFYKDEPFKATMEKIEEYFNDMKAERVVEKGELNEDDEKTIDFLRAKARLSVLMKLIGRKGFYPEQEMGASEEGGVYVPESEPENIET